MPFRRFPSALVAGLLCIHAGLLAWAGAQHSPSSNEAGHLPAGIHIWHFGRFDLYCVNPPLVRVLAALPAVACRARTDWSRHGRPLWERPEWGVGPDFVRANDPRDVLRYYMLGRWMLIPLMLLGGYVCWRWADRLYGPPCGLLALALWCFSPNVIAWGATICPDGVAAAMGVVGGYSFWRWLDKPGWLRALAAGLLLGIVQLTKTTWIVLFGLWPLVWLVCTWGRRLQPDRGTLFQQARQLAAILVLGLYVINMGYSFEGSFQPLRDYTFVSRTLAGPDSRAEKGEGGNRFADSWLGVLPVPLPRDYLLGLDLQKLDFEEGGWSYLYGRWRYGGWWHYYLSAAMVKVPVGTWVLGLAAVGLGIRRCFRGKARRHSLSPSQDATTPPAPWRNELALLAPAVIVFLLVSSQTGFNRHFRYVLPAFPFLFIWFSKVARPAANKPRTLGLLAAAALAWSAASSLWIYPHSMSYFNELAGGPKGGPRFLLDANVDWGQDVLYLRDWCLRHPEATPLHVLFKNTCSDHLFATDDIRKPPAGPGKAGQRAFPHEPEPRHLGPLPGWHAVSVHRIHDPADRYLYFLRFTPVAMAGYSTWIYHVSPEEANRVRRELELPELPD